MSDLMQTIPVFLSKNIWVRIHWFYILLIVIETLVLRGGFPHMVLLEDMVRSCHIEVVCFVQLGDVQAYSLVKPEASSRVLGCEAL